MAKRKRGPCIQPLYNSQLTIQARKHNPCHQTPYVMSGFYYSSYFSTRLAAVKVGTSLTIRSGLAIALRLPSAEVEEYGVRCNNWVFKLTAAKGLYKWGEERPR